MTGQDLIKSSMRLIGAIDPTETPTDQEGQDALLILNQMIDEWNAERQMIFTVPMQEFPLTAGQQLYTMGPGGNFNTARPARIERMGIVQLSNPAQPLELPLEYLTHEQWAAIPVKLILSSLPQKVYDDQAFPLRNLQFWCVPNVVVNVRIYAWQALSQFNSLIDNKVFPPAYLKAIRYNLAVDLAAEFPGNPVLMPGVIRMAMSSKAKVKALNAPIIDMRCDRAVSGQGDRPIYNWLTDGPAAR